MAAGAERAGTSAAVTVIVGDEELLVDRAVSVAVSQAIAAVTAPDVTVPHVTEPDVTEPDVTEPDVTEQDVTVPGGTADVHVIPAAGLSVGQLASLTAPSLFGGASVVVIRSAEDASASLAGELTRLARAPVPEAHLVITHSGGAKNKTLLADLAAAGARRVDCPAIKRFSDRMDFLRGEFRRAGRKADDSGLRALLDAVGTDLRDLAAACSQLVADTTGVVSQAVVARYYQGRAEATGFSVADKACEGSLSEALEQLRWALATGTSPVLITSALASGLRTLALVGSAGRGLNPNALAADLGMPPWKIDKARQQLRGWTSAGLARAHAAVAEADVQVKGEGASAAYALERVVTTIVACHGVGR